MYTLVYPVKLFTLLNCNCSAKQIDGENLQTFVHWWALMYFGVFQPLVVLYCTVYTCNVQCTLVMYTCNVHCTLVIYTVHFVPYDCTLGCNPQVHSIKWTIAAVSRNRTHQLLHSPPSTPLNQDTLTLTPLLLPLCSISTLFCISTVFVCLLQNFVAFMCIHSTDVHHPESEPSIWHFHGFQVIANWRLAQIARCWLHARCAPEKQTKDKKLWWYLVLDSLMVCETQNIKFEINLKAENLLDMWLQWTRTNIDVISDEDIKPLSSWTGWKIWLSKFLEIQVINWECPTYILHRWNEHHNFNCPRYIKLPKIGLLSGIARISTWAPLYLHIFTCILHL